MAFTLKTATPSRFSSLAMAMTHRRRFWCPIHQRTRSYAVLIDDPDAPNGLFTHWMAYDVPADGTELKATAGKDS
jgi:phosphatidylethanolamine-binding protein (PEBP) family uncharacterized protein